MKPFKQVDVFTDTIGLGNPVAVVLDGSGLTTEQMQRFAAWTNLSETTFVDEPTDTNADYRVRIFTPADELPFAGHPTIGTCHAWLEAGGIARSDSQIVQQCEAGLIPLRKSGSRLAFATPSLIRSGEPTREVRQQLIANLAISAEQIVGCEWVDNGPGWLGVLVDSVDTLRALAPSLSGELVAVGVAAVTDKAEPALEVRAFFEAGGTREDPVTGSLNGSLAQWLIGNGTLPSTYVASQGRQIGRDGRIAVSSADGEIWIGGDAVTVIDGFVTPA